jgi:hypothetical protein
MYSEMNAFICVVGIHVSENLKWKRIFSTCETSKSSAPIQMGIQISISTPYLAEDGPQL